MREMSFLVYNNEDLLINICIIMLYFYLFFKVNEVGIILVKWEFFKWNLRRICFNLKYV